MRIAVIGATGMVGSRVLAEAMSRGHSLTAAARHVSSLASLDGDVRMCEADVLDPGSVALAIQGSEVVVVAVRLTGAESTGDERADAPPYAAAVESLLSGLGRASVSRLIMVGGAGTLKVPPGIRLADSPEFPERFRANASAQAAGVEALLSAGPEVAWSCICPPFSLAPGKRTGRYRTGNDYLLRDESGDSAISAEDFAVAILDEAEHPRHDRHVFTVAGMVQAPLPEGTDGKDGQLDRG